MIIHSFSGVKGRLIFINRGCKSHLKNNTKAKWKLYLLGLFMGYLSVGLRQIFLHSQYFFYKKMILVIWKPTLWRKLLYLVACRKHLVWNFKAYSERMEKMRRNGVCQAYVSACDRPLLLRWNRLTDKANLKMPRLLQEEIEFDL